MRILVAGATGAIGRPLVRMFIGRGHEVLGTTRSGERAQVIAALGAQPVVVDALDGDSVHDMIRQHEPEVIVNQLTALSSPLSPRSYIRWIEPTNRLRSEGTRNLTEAARAAGTRLFVSQSIAFAYRWEGTARKNEADPLFDGDLGFAQAVAALRELEARTLRTPGLHGIVMRYGYFYGPRTSYASDGDVADLVRRRRFPIVGAGTGEFSFIHVEDAAAATVTAVERGAVGTFNVVDDEPAEMREWLPYFAQLVGAKRPWRVPLWLARLGTARFVADAAVKQKGASNERAKRQLEWRPDWPSWRDGFRATLQQPGEPANRHSDRAGAHDARRAS